MHFLHDQLEDTAWPQAPTVTFDPALLTKYQRSGPRYTSYPTADRFTDGFGGEMVDRRIAERNRNASAGSWSVYVHLPFCATVCYYCGCNRIVTANRRHATAYVDDLMREIALYGERLDEQRSMRQLHLGGGTPTYLSHEEMSRLLASLRGELDFLPLAELAIEVDPRTVDPDRVEALAQLGFNRMSLGVQDFDPDVQVAVNRVQSEAQTVEVVKAARTNGFRSINVDLIYGLPRQTPERFERTLDTVIAFAPDRIALYSYAHLPALFKAQRQIDEAQLPDSETKLAILGLAIDRLTCAGYVYVGMDHFALPGDELALAQRNGRLQRNFQGYSTYAGHDLLAFGVSGIGSLGTTYYQNHRDLSAYRDALSRGALPIARGFELGTDDLLRRDVIQALMCQFSLSKAAVEAQHGIDFERYFASELTELGTFAADGLIELEAERIVVTASGRLLVRNIAMVFDRHLRDARAGRYSKVI